MDIHPLQPTPSDELVNTETKMSLNKTSSNIIFTRNTIKSEYNVATWYGYLCPQTPPCKSSMNTEVKMLLNKTMTTA
jgi:hypothetical protein